MPNSPVPPQFFETPEQFRAWLHTHGGAANELIVGFHKRGSGLASMTWPESVDEALCVGWIDGVRTRIDDTSYKIRFTPRRPTSTWSAINIARFAVLEAEGRITERGLDAYARRSEARSRTYAYEQVQRAELSPEQQAAFRKHRTAWQFFEAQAPSYKHRMAWWVSSAKREDTRQSRLARLIEASELGKRL